MASLSPSDDEHSDDEPPTFSQSGTPGGISKNNSGARIDEFCRNDEKLFSQWRNGDQPLVVCKHSEPAYEDKKRVYDYEGVPMRVGCSAHASTAEDVFRVFAPPDVGDNMADFPRMEDKAGIAKARAEWQKYADTRSEFQVAFEKAAEGSDARKDAKKALQRFDELPPTCRICRVKVDHISKVSMEPFLIPIVDASTQNGTPNAIFKGASKRCKGVLWCRNSVTHDAERNACSSAREETCTGCYSFKVSAKKSPLVSDGYKLTCNTCGVEQGNIINTDADAQQGYGNDQAQTAAERDAHKSRERTEEHYDNLYAALDIDSNRVLSAAERKQEHWCDEHQNQGFTPGCEACWRLFEHRCTCPKHDVSTMTIVREKMDEFKNFIRNRGWMSTGVELLKLIAGHDQERKRCWPIKKIDNIEKIANMLDSEKLAAKREKLRKETAVLQGDNLIEETAFEHFRTIVEECCKQRNFSWTKCNASKCIASNPKLRAEAAERKKENEYFTAAVEQARGRWDECIDWFHFLWGREGSPYLSPADRVAYQEILHAALKDPEEYKRLCEIPARGSLHNPNWQANGFVWSIWIAMATQYQKCVVAPTQGSSDGEAVPLMGIEVATDSDAFKYGRWGVTKESQSDRWTVAEMCKYACNNPHLYKDQQKRCTVEAVSTGNSAQQILVAKQVVRREGHRAAGLATLVAALPVFLNTEGTRESKFKLARDNPKERKRFLAQGARAPYKLDGAIRKHKFGLNALDALLRREVEGKKDFRKGGLPLCMMNMVVEEPTTNAQGQTHNKPLWKDLSNAPGGFLKLEGEAAKAAELRYERDAKEAEDAWERVKMKNAEVETEKEKAMKGKIEPGTQTIGSRDAQNSKGVKLAGAKTKVMKEEFVPQFGNIKVDAGDGRKLTPREKLILRGQQGATHTAVAPPHRKKNMKMPEVPAAKTKRKRVKGVSRTMTPEARAATIRLLKAERKEELEQERKEKAKQLKADKKIEKRLEKEAKQIAKRYGVLKRSAEIDRRAYRLLKRAKAKKMYDAQMDAWEAGGKPSGCRPKRPDILRPPRKKKARPSEEPEASSSDETEEEEEEQEAWAMDVDGNEGDVLGLAGSIWQDDGNAAASDSLPAQEEEDEDEEDVYEDDYNPMVMVDGEEMPFYAVDEEDQRRMTHEEYDVYAALWQELS